MMDLESGTYSTVGQELIIDLGDVIGIHTVFLLNNMMMSGDGNEYKNIYGSQIHVGSGSSFHSCDPVSGMIEDGGYFPLDSVTTDRYLSVRRPNCELDGDCSAWYDEYNGQYYYNSMMFRLASIRLYQVPNIIQKFESLVEQAPEGTSVYLSADNLIQNLDKINARSDINPAGGSTKSCYKTNKINVQQVNGDDVFVLGFDHQESYFQHAILVLEEVGDYYYDPKEQWEVFNKFNIYIGDSANYMDNTLCEGGPFMLHEQDESVENSGYQPDPWYNPTDEYAYQNWEWRYISETWCNLKGQYTHIVRDYSGMSESYEINLCSVGVMGAKYIRDTPLNDIEEVEEGSTATFQIDKIYSEFEIGNILNIALRQVTGSDLSWVTFDEFPTYTLVTLDATAVSPGDYTYSLESYDANGTVQSTLESDTQTIRVTASIAEEPEVPPTCSLTQEDFNAFYELHDEHFQLQVKGIGSDQQTFDDLIAEAEEYFNLNDESQAALCGSLTHDFVNTYAFLSQDEEEQYIELTWTTLEDGSEIKEYADSQFDLIMGDLNLKLSIPVQATILPCQLTHVEFTKTADNLDYEIGSGQLRRPLPETVQTEDCGRVFTHVDTIASNLLEDDVRGAVSLLEDPYPMIVVNTDDESKFADEVVTISVVLDGISELEDPYVLKITFKRAPQQFDRTGYSVEPLTCSEDDASWSMPLPPVENADEQTLIVEMLSKSELFTYSQNEPVKLSNEIRLKFLAGALCPADSEINLEFLISSEGKVDANEILTIPIKPHQEVTEVDTVTSGISFDGVDVDEIDALLAAQNKGQGNQKKLEIGKITMSSTGDLEIRFSKRILKPPLRIKSTDQENDLETRLLQTTEAESGQLLYEIEDVIRVSVADDDDTDDTDKSIAGIELDEADEYSLKMRVTFSDTDAITQDVKEPDVLQVEVLKPGLFIDAETLEPMGIQSQVAAEVELKPQLRKDEYEELELMAAAAVTAGLLASVVEIVICFILGKALEAAWTIVYAMQFLVFIGMWQISYTKRLRFFFKELKRIALGEFLDDIGIEERIIEVFGFEEPEEDNGPEDQIGYNRFGSPGLFQSLGPTYFMSLGMFGLIIGLTLLAICIGRRMKLQEKNVKRLHGLEDSLFYNPIIRVSMLSGIKTNMSALLIFRLMSHNTFQLIMAVLLFTLFNLLPIYYARILYKNGDQLEKEENIRKFGSLYDNKNVKKDRKHRVWAHPLTFFYRRTVFAVITVYLFDTPSMQMIVLQVTSLLTIAYLSWDEDKFKLRSIRFIEIYSEALLLVIISLIQQLTLPQPQEAQQDLEIMIFVAFGLLLGFNAAFVIYNVVINCQDKRRKQAHEKRREEWEKTNKVDSSKLSKTEPLVDTKTVNRPAPMESRGSAILAAIIEESKSHQSVNNSVNNGGAPNEVASVVVSDRRDGKRDEKHDEQMDVPNHYSMQSKVAGGVQRRIQHMAEQRLSPRNYDQENDTDDNGEIESFYNNRGVTALSRAKQRRKAQMAQATQGMIQTNGDEKGDSIFMFQNSASAGQGMVINPSKHADSDMMIDAQEPHDQKKKVSFAVNDRPVTRAINAPQGHGNSHYRVKSTSINPIVDQLAEHTEASAKKQLAELRAQMDGLMREIDEQMQE